VSELQYMQERLMKGEGKTGFWNMMFGNGTFLILIALLAVAVTILIGVKIYQGYKQNKIIEDIERTVKNVKKNKKVTKKTEEKPELNENKEKIKNIEKDEKIEKQEIEELEKNENNDENTKKDDNLKKNE